MTDLLKTLDPIFADCLGENCRFLLGEPWIQKGFVYATNGSILVRQPTTLPETQRRGPPAWQNFDDTKAVGRIIRLPDLGPELADRTVCPTCKGTDSTKTCGDCKGAGKHVCPTCEHVKPCRPCEGEGNLCCSECEGAGALSRKRQSVKLRPAHEAGLADFYVWLLQRHGIDSVRTAKCPNGFAFRFHKGTIEGIVMGMALRDR